MQTKLLEAQAIINENLIDILNTEMDISVYWDFNVIKNEYSVNFSFVFEKVKGAFTYTKKYQSYKKATQINFETDDTWRISYKYDEKFTEPLEPVSALINFDFKTITITL
jgi:hypothetical protein